MKSLSGSVMEKIAHISSGAVVFVPDDRFNVILIQARRHSGLFWGLPKGHIDEGETLAQAALREAEEETGLAASSLQLICYLQPVFYEFLTHDNGIERLNSKTVHFFLAQAPAKLPGLSPLFENEGILQASWIPIGDAKELVTFSNYRSVLETTEKALHLA